MIFLKNSYWSLFISLIILSLILVIVIQIGKWSFNQKIKNEIDQIKAANKKTDFKTQPISKEDLKKLPNNAAVWLEKVGVVGKKNITAVNLKQSGAMKLSPDQKKLYKPKARQFISIKNPAYLWQVELSMLPIVNTKGRDLFFDGKASMIFKIAHLFPIVDQKTNAKINESALHRFLLELPWYPTAALNDYLLWEEVNSTTARATINYQETKAVADFIFDQEGNLLRTEAMRYKESNETAERLKCSGEINSYQDVDGIKVPTEIDVSWHLDSGTFTWFKVKIEEIDFEY